MANLDFYGLRADLLKLLSYIYDETDMIIFESYSEYDCPLRRFTSLSELQSAFEIGRIQKGQVLLQLWSPSITDEPRPRRIELKLKSSSFRYTVEGAGLIQLYLGGLRETAIAESSYGHWNKAGAEKRSVLPTDNCDWGSLKKISGRLQRFIRGLAVAKFSGRVILPEAFNEIKNGKRLRFLNQEFDSRSVDIISLAKEV